MPNSKIKDLLLLPSLEEAKRILCIQPHPDDNEIGAGASIAKLVQNGAIVSYLTVTDGRIGTENPDMLPEELAKVRKKETIAAAEVLGVKKMFWMGFPDSGDLHLNTVRAGIVEVIRQFKPDVVMTPDPWLNYEAHSDHRIVGLAAAEAVIYSKFPHFCPEHRQKGLEPHQVSFIAFYYTSRPNTFSDVDATWQLKLDAIGKHQSQFPPPVFDLLGVYLTAKARELAENRNCEMVEAFKILTPLHLHSFEYAEDC